jgi:ABC-type antimicrobial peptide transport system permease subunit
VAKFGVGVFILGAILLAIGTTDSQSHNLYFLFGIIIGAIGIGIMYLAGNSRGR